MTLFRPERRSAYGPTYNPFDRPSLPLAAVGLDGMFNGTDAGEIVTPENAFVVPTVLRAIQIISTLVGGCPLCVHKEPSKKPIRFPLLDVGNDETTYTPFELWELATVHLCGWGDAFIRKVRNGADQIVDLKPIFPGIVKVKIERESGEKIFLVKRVRSDGTISADPPEVLTTWEIMHVPGMGYDGLNGLSPIGMCKRTIGTAIAGDKLAANFFAKGSILGGIVKVKAPLASQEQADAIKRRWRQTHGGVDNAGDVAVFDAETDFQPITINPVDLQFLESRQWSVSEIGTLFGIPGHLLNGQNQASSWGSGIEQMNLGLASYTINFYTKRIEQRFTREVVNVRGQYAEFNLDRLMRGSMADRFAAYGLGIQWGWLTRAEVREDEGRPPIDGLDEPIMPMNMSVGGEPPMGGTQMPKGTVNGN